MKIVLVGRDMAPSQAFAMLAEELKKAGHEVALFAGYGKPLDVPLAEILSAIEAANCVVIGMSSSADLAEEEIAAARQATAISVPFGLYVDSYGACAKEWFAEFREKADFLFVINEGEREKAGKIFSPTRIIISGNPTWEQFTFPKFSRREARWAVGAADDEILILSPGCKSPVINILLWGTLLDALNEIKGFKFRIVFCYHPGDRTVSAADPALIVKYKKESGCDVDDLKLNLNIYGHLFDFSPVPVGITPLGLNTADILTGADLVVDWDTTVAIGAALMRIPVISAASIIGRRQKFFNTKMETLKVCELKVSRLVRGPEEMERAIRELLTPEGAAAQKKIQEEFYPVSPDKGASVRIMAEALEVRIQEIKK